MSGPTLPRRCECDQPLAHGGVCLKCGHQVIEPAPKQAAGYEHAGRWPKRTVCPRCGAPVLKARGQKAGAPFTLDVGETAGFRPGDRDKMYLTPDGVARPCRSLAARRPHDAVHRRHSCLRGHNPPGEVEDDPGWVALAAAVGPPFYPEKLRRRERRIARPR